MKKQEYEVCLNGQWFYIDDNLIDKYLDIPGITIYRIVRELIVSNQPPISDPPQPSSTSPENP